MNPDRERQLQLEMNKGDDNEPRCRTSQIEELANQPPSKRHSKIRKLFKSSKTLDNRKATKQLKQLQAANGVTSSETKNNGASGKSLEMEVLLTRTNK
jgi:hypothetical protein